MRVRLCGVVNRWCGDWEERERGERERGRFGGNGWREKIVENIPSKAPFPRHATNPFVFIFFVFLLAPPVLAPLSLLKAFPLISIPLLSPPPNSLPFSLTISKHRSLPSLHLSVCQFKSGVRGRVRASERGRETGGKVTTKRNNKQV